MCVSNQAVTNIFMRTLFFLAGLICTFLNILTEKRNMSSHWAVNACKVSFFLVNKNLFYTGILHLACFNFKHITYPLHASPHVSLSHLRVPSNR